MKATTLNTAHPIAADTRSVVVFTRSVASAERLSEPFLHWRLSDILDEPVMDAVAALPVGVLDFEYSSGKREEHNGSRTYLDPDMIARFGACRTVAETLQRPDAVRMIEERCDIALSGCYLRIEYARDRNGFWLAPHTDIGVKMLTLLIYLNDAFADEDWGTDIYRNPEDHFGSIPFRRNNGMMMVPSDVTWHGFERRPITGIRRSLIVNYVTGEWRNRHELAFPHQPIA